MLEQKLEELTCAINALTGMLATIGLSAKEAPAPRAKRTKQAEEHTAQAAPPVVEEPVAAPQPEPRPEPQPEPAVEPTVEAFADVEDPEPTQADISALVMAIVRDKGRDVALGALAGLGVKNAREIDPANYREAVHALRAAAES
jgi:outer membrane biosynthesis protein TonB